MLAVHQPSESVIFYTSLLMVSTGNHTQVVFSGVDSVYIYIYPIGSMYGIYANIWGILMVNVTIYTIHGSYGYIQVYYINMFLATHRTAHRSLVHWKAPRCHGAAAPAQRGCTLHKWFTQRARWNSLRERMACAVRGQGPESILIGSLPELDEGNGQWKNVNLPNQSNETPRVWGPCKGDPDFLWPSLCFRKLFWDIATGTDNMTCSSFQSASGDDTWEYNQKRMCKMSMDWSCWENLSWKPT